MPWLSQPGDIVCRDVNAANAVNIADHTDSQPFSAHLAAVLYRRVVVEMAV